MHLRSGQRLGAYEIIGPLGAGGMGEVYRARHVALDRLVAIKVLPARLAAEPEARARFEREAKAVAALSHPNILAIHDFAVDGTTSYAVMELLEGSTLRERLAEGPLPIKKALEIAREIALGLAAAHDAGFVHRDIKPENIFIGRSGQVKILDFGLARATSDSMAADAGLITTVMNTEPGMLMGTVSYMSPEQVKRQPVDDRSDLFSLGCVLFEMIGGRRAFERETAAETMTAVLRDDPPELTRPDQPVPAALDRLVRHCLEKNPEERFQSARDLSFALQFSLSISISVLTSASAESSASSAPAPGGEGEPARGFWRSLARPWQVAAFAALGVIGAGAFVTGRIVGSASARAHAATDADAPRIASFQQLTDRAGVETSPALSPDGKTVVYVSDAAGSADLYSIRIGDRVATPLTPDSPSEDTQPAFSPDGERIAFRSTRDGGGIFLMEPDGESVTRLTDAGFNPSWSPDGREIVLAQTTFVYPTDRPGRLDRGLVAVDAATAARRTIAAYGDAMQPAWSPHGARIAYWGLRGNSGQRDLWTIAADGSEAARGGVTVTNDTALDWSPAWSPDGRYLYFSSDRGGTVNLWRVAIDEASGRVLGEPEPVTTPAAWSGGITFSRDGSRLAFATLDWRSTLMRAAFDPIREAVSGAPAAILKSTRPIRDHELSPDGQWVAYSEFSLQEDVLVARTDGSEYRRLTGDRFRHRGPAWAPDGTRIAFYSDRGGAYEVWTIRPDGSGLQRITSIGRANFPVWSPDGHRLALFGIASKGWFIVNSQPDGTSDRLIALPAAANPPGDFWPLSWSGDGRIAGVTVDADGSATRLAVYDEASHRYELVPGGTAPGWQVPIWIGAVGAATEGRSRLIVRDANGISLVHPATGTRRPLLPVRGYAMGRGVGVSRDGRWITYTETATEGDIWLASFARP